MNPVTHTGNEDFNVAVKLYNILGKLMRRLRKQSGKQAFSTTEQATLALLDSNGPMLPSELAEAHHISAQGVSQIVNRLFDQGIIDKEPDLSDKRKIYVSLTKSGHQELLAIRSIRSKWLAETIGDALTLKEKNTLQEAIDLLDRLAIH